MWGLLVFSPVLSTFVQQPLQALFAGVPVLGALFSGPPVGIGLLSAGIILAIMIIPFIASVMRDVFEVTPALLKESAYGLGSTTWEVMFKVVLPYTKTGVVGGIMLGLGRALGETMAVTFVIGNFNQLNSLSLFEAANSITSALANEFAEAGEGLHKASLMYLGLVLFFITFVVLACSKLLLARLKQREGVRS
jgi:phosphate transport system permease protein